jgi:hypothetical protein
LNRIDVRANRQVSADLKSFSKRPGDGDVKLTAEAMNQSSIKWDLRPRSKGR